MFAQTNMADKSKILSLLDSGLVPTNYILVLSGTLSECACLNQLPAAGNRIDKSPETNCAFTCCQNNQDIFFCDWEHFCECLFSSEQQDYGAQVSELMPCESERCRLNANIGLIVET